MAVQLVESRPSRGGQIHNDKHTPTVFSQVVPSSAQQTNNASSASYDTEEAGGGVEQLCSHLFSPDGLFQVGTNMDYRTYVVYMYVHVSYMYCIFPTFSANVFNPYSRMTKSEVKD